MTTIKCYWEKLEILTRNWAKTGPQWVNALIFRYSYENSLGWCHETSLVPGIYRCGFENAIFNLVLACVNTLRPRQKGRHFPDDIFKCIFLFENVWIWIKISLKCVPKVRINNIPALVQIMAWHRIGDKPLSESMMVNLLTHICVTRPQWVNARIFLWKFPRLMPRDFTGDKSTLVEVMTWYHQATSNYLRQDWPISLSPDGVTKPQRVNVERWFH